MEMSNEKNQPQVSCVLGKPALTDAQATRLVEAIYGLQVSQIKPLPSYDDQNFHIITKDVDKTTSTSDFVLKITNCEDSKNEDLLSVQSYVMSFLADEGFPTAATVPTKDNKIMSLESIEHGTEKKEHMVRLLTYLPGIPLAKMGAGPTVLYEVGKLAARMNTTLAKCNHPKIKSLDREHFIWNLANIPMLDGLVYAVDQKRLREVVEQTILEFKNHVLPHLGDFRKCINHGDLNDHNILLQPVSKEPFGDKQDVRRISGILDFNDMSSGHYVFEVAIAMMYMMIESPTPLKAAGYVLAGYQSIVALNPVERDALYTLVKCRFAQSLVLAKYTVLQHPENEDYIMITSKTGWKHLLSLADLGKEAVEKLWFDTVKEYSESN